MKNHARISLFASANRPNLFLSFLDSLIGTTIELEVVFSGPVWSYDIIQAGVTNHKTCELKNNHIQFKYIATKNIKPAQCYEIARRHCTGELIHWTADDCEYTKDFLALAYDYWKNQNNRKLVLSLQTKENYGYSVLTDMKVHSFFGEHPETPLMAPLGLMSREYLEELGGYDCRYISGQTENDIVMRVYADGGRCEIFGDNKNYIEIDHVNKHSKTKTMKDHYARPFAKAYFHDRKILQGSWGETPKTVSLKRNDKFEPFVNDEHNSLYYKSQSFNLEDIWE